MLLGAAAVSSRDWRRIPGRTAATFIQILVHHEGKERSEDLRAGAAFCRNEVMTR